MFNSLHLFAVKSGGNGKLAGIMLVPFGLYSLIASFIHSFLVFIHLSY